jgi:methionine synthase II (cobalamin-independent)
MEKAIRYVVAKQKEAGIDIGNDGEQQRVGFQTYVPQRMSGFGGESKRRRGREFEGFPELVSYLTRRFPNVSRQQNAPPAQGEIHYHDTSAIEREIALYKRIAGEGTPFAESFMTAPSPGIIASTMLNAFYDTNEAYLAAIAREMRPEYQAIHKAGLVLQIDAPDLAMDRTMFYRDGFDADFVKACELHVAMINKSIEGIPPDQVRLHVCYGNWEGPHIHDIALEKILPALYQAKVGALSIEFSNPRHAHEYAALQRVPFPKDRSSSPAWWSQPAISSSIRKWWRGGSRKWWPRSATASASSLRPIAASAPSRGANGLSSQWSGSSSSRSATVPILRQRGCGGGRARREPVHCVGLAVTARRNSAPKNPEFVTIPGLQRTTACCAARAPSWTAWPVTSPSSPT